LITADGVAVPLAVHEEYGALRSAFGGEYALDVARLRLRGGGGHGPDDEVEIPLAR